METILILRNTLKTYETIIYLRPRNVSKLQSLRLKRRQYSRVILVSCSSHKQFNTFRNCNDLSIATCARQVSRIAAASMRRERKPFTSKSRSGAPRSIFQETHLSTNCGRHETCLPVHRSVLILLDQILFPMKSVIIVVIKKREYPYDMQNTHSNPLYLARGTRGLNGSAEFTLPVRSAGRTPKQLID